MRNSRGGYCLGILLLIASLQATSGPANSQSVADLVDKVRPSVAFVLARGEGQVASGSAFVADAEGLLVTALHVVADARTISILLPGGSPETADVVAVDVPSDLAALRIAQNGLSALSLGNMSTLRTGQDVVVIGYPVATILAPSAVTVTRGIVSAIRPPFIQVDAAMNPGNSGGPVLDSGGNVIGVADWKVVLTGVQGLNFAVSADAVKSLLSTVLDPAKTHSPLPLPLTTTREVELSYESGGIGSQRIDKLGVSCASPPPGAQSLSGARGELHAPSELDVVTWLSFDGGAPLRGQGTFAYLQQNGTTIESGNVSPLPNSICLNYAAVRRAFDLIGYTFRVTYRLFYKVWSSAVAP
jgi:S1-C subfamily serine protease